METSKTFKASVLAILLAVPGVSSASNLNPWTQCGIGAMIFSDAPAAAAISNIIWDLGTTAITSAGLSENSCSGKKAVTAQFIHNTYAILEEETAKGGGQYINAMLTIMGCDSAAHNGIAQSIRADFIQSMQDSSYIEKQPLAKSEAYYNIVQKHVASEYSQQCPVNS